MTFLSCFKVVLFIGYCLLFMQAGMEWLEWLEGLEWLEWLECWNEMLQWNVDMLECWNINKQAIRSRNNSSVKRSVRGLSLRHANWANTGLSRCKHTL